MQKQESTLRPKKMNISIPRKKPRLDMEGDTRYVEGSFRNPKGEYFKAQNQLEHVVLIPGTNSLIKIESIKQT